MFRLATHRIRTIMLVVLALLFSQLALASYICPVGGSGSQPVMEMAPGESCEGLAQVRDQDQPMLCHQHCTGAPQAADLVKLPVVSLPAIVHVVVLPLVLASAPSEGGQAQEAEPQPPAEPIFLSTLRLRV